MIVVTTGDNSDGDNTLDGDNSEVHKVKFITQRKFKL